VISTWIISSVSLSVQCVPFCENLIPNTIIYRRIRPALEEKYREIFALLGCYAAYIGILFRNNISVPLSRVILLLLHP
jgi:hypothetical protein